MAKDPAFLFYPGDYLRDTQNLSENSQVAYDRIMCEHMRNICISQQQLKFFTKRLSDDEIDELMFVLTEIEGGYQIDWVAESIVKRREYSKSRRNNRKGKVKNISKSYDKHMENENEIENKDVIKKEKEIGKKLKERMDDFVTDVKKYCDEKGISDSSMKKFILYWTDHNEKKMKWELQKTFSIPHRIGTWIENEQQFISKSKSSISESAREVLERGSSYNKI